MMRIHTELLSRFDYNQMICLKSWDREPCRDFLGRLDGVRQAAGPWQRGGASEQRGRGRKEQLELSSATCSSGSVTYCKCPPLYWGPRIEESGPAALCPSCRQTRTAPGPVRQRERRGFNVYDHGMKTCRQLVLKRCIIGEELVRALCK